MSQDFRRWKCATCGNIWETEVPIEDWLPESVRLVDGFVDGRRTQPEFCSWQCAAEWCKARAAEERHAAGLFGEGAK